MYTNDSGNTGGQGGGQGCSPLQLELVDSLPAPDHIDCLDAQVLGIGDQLLPQHTRGSILQQPALTKALHMPAAQVHPKLLITLSLCMFSESPPAVTEMVQGATAVRMQVLGECFFNAACPELCAASAIVAHAATLAA